MAKPNDGGRRTSDMRLIVGMDENGVARPLLTDTAGRLTIVNERTVHAARVTESAFTHSASGFWQTVTFSSEDFDSEGMHSVSVNTSRLTIVTAGIYLVGGSFRFAASGTGSRAIRLLLGGATEIAQLLAPAAAAAQALALASLYSFTVGQYVELQGFQNSGGNLAMDLASFWAAML